MESQFSVTRFLLLLTTILCFLHCISCVEFQVGERVGWAVPPTNNTTFYNEWASQKRFKLGDAIFFKYRKDSVMEVNHSNYDSCDSTRPNFFSNTGNTIYTLDRSGFFYFISGAAGHCNKGQKLIVWVIKQDELLKGKPRSSGSSVASKYPAMVSYGVVFAMAAFHVFLSLNM